MSMASFDTLEAAKALKEAGFNEQQAEALVVAVSRATTENLATKADLENAIENLEHRMTIKLGGMIAAAAGFLVVVDKLL